MNGKFEQAFAEANDRLKAGRIKVRIEQKKMALVLRATLPPKPDSDKVNPYQQRIWIGASANMIGLARAEREAKKLGAALANKEFDWSDYGFGSQKGSCGFWIDKLEAQFWAQRQRTTATESTWKTYQPFLNRLIKNEPLTIAALENAVLTSKPDSRSRQKYVTFAAKLARVAGIDPSPLMMLKGNYGVESVNPRELPTTEKIIEVWDAINHPAWRWVYGMIAIYGLRPHEVFGLDLSQWDTIYTYKRTKSKKGRFIYPARPDWCDRVGEMELPKLAELDKPLEDWDFSHLGSKVSKYFYKNLPFNAYSLRHCYARDCFEIGMPADMAATLMGHSLKIHLQVYRNFWGEDTYRKRYEQLINGSKDSD